MSKKIHHDYDELLKVVKDSDTILVGGFGLIGAPLSLIEGLTRRDVKDLTIVSNNLGESGEGLGKVLNQGKISKAIGSYFTSNRDVGDAYLRGEIELQLTPQGTMAEGIRAAGAGIGGFYTKTSAGTDLAKGKETREIDGELYVLENPIKGNVSFVRAHKADKLGNLTYYKTARNFNPEMATASDFVIAEVDEIVEVGELNPEEVVTPHVYVDAIIVADHILTNEGIEVNE